MTCSTPPMRSATALRPAHRLLLRAALLPGREARSAWDAWCSQVDFDAVDPVSLPILPLVVHNLGADASVGLLRARFLGIWRYVWVRNGLLYGDLTQVLELFGAASVPTLILGGAALGATCYRGGGLRAITGVDVLVPADRAAPAMALLQGRGGRLPMGRRGPAKAPERVIPVRCAHTFRSASGRDVRLHWHALLPGCDADAAFWEGSRSLTLNGLDTRTLCPPDQLLHACVHGAYDRVSPGLIWAADATYILRAAGDSFDWDRLMRLGAECRLRLALRDALAWLVATVEAPVPASVIRSLSGGPVSAFERLEQAARLGPPARWRKAVGHLGHYTRSTRGRRLSARLFGLFDYVARVTEAEGPRDALVRAWASLRSGR
jgi:hypothetical protein